jgi:hypothetical protein
MTIGVVTGKAIIREARFAFITYAIVAVAAVGIAIGAAWLGHPIFTFEDRPPITKSSPVKDEPPPAFQLPAPRQVEPTIAKDPPSGLPRIAVPPDVAGVPVSELRPKDLLGKKYYGANNELIGVISKVNVDSKGNILSMEVTKPLPSVEVLKVGNDRVIAPN